MEAGAGEARPRAGAVEIWTATGDGSAGRLQRRLRGELDSIVMKAIRKEPGRRYGSVQALSADLRRHLDGLPAGVGLDEMTYRAARFASRHRALLLVGGALLLAGGAVTLQQWLARPAAPIVGDAPFELFAVECSSTGLACTEQFSREVRTAGALTVDYRITSEFCGNILLDVLVDGRVVRSALGPLGPASLGGAHGTGRLDLGPVSAGIHTVALGAVGVRNSGCVRDELDVWGGHVQLQGGG
jgi:hypothetical protein